HSYRHFQISPFPLKKALKKAGILAPPIRTQYANAIARGKSPTPYRKLGANTFLSRWRNGQLIMNDLDRQK
ncbi:MAG TPA: hypothetical protein VI479_00080, partial [Blastocatellia bacterium]